MDIINHILHPRKAFFHNKSRVVIQLWQGLLEKIFWNKIKERVFLAKRIGIDKLSFNIPKEKGYLILPKESMQSEIDGVIVETDKIVEKYIHSNKHQDIFLTRHGKKTKQHFDSLLLRKSLDNLTPESPFIKLALHPEIIECISEYPSDSKVKHYRNMVLKIY